MSIMLQYVFKPLPGSDLARIIEHAQIAAKLWKKHGAKEVSLWNISNGEIGNLAFTVPFENYSDYGRCYDALLADPDFRKWQVDLVKAGLSEWVRSNIARRINLE
jgi:hypothetical protein